MKKIIWVLGLSGLGFFLIWMWNKSNFFLDPLSNNAKEINIKGDFEIFGFLPTWMVGKTREYSNQMSHLIFLGIETDERGNLIWDTQSKKIYSESYLAQKRIIAENGGKNILGIKLFDDNKLKTLLGDKEAVANLTRQIKEVVVEENFDGVNLDFEFQGDPLAILGEEFGFFVDGLKLAGLEEISVDVFANTIIKGDEQKLKTLLGKIDNLIVMAYDFHRPGVDFAGAVAPIGSNIGERNIREVLEKILLVNLDKNKIIMAYPLYGYEWETYTKDFESQIKRGWYQMVSWRRMKELLADTAFVETSSVKWDELSMSPWVVFEQDKKIHQIYFENEKSLSAKIDLAKQNKLGGWGFWALGYEGEDEFVWSF